MKRILFILAIIILLLTASFAGILKEEKITKLNQDIDYTEMDVDDIDWDSLPTIYK